MASSFSLWVTIPRTEEVHEKNQVMLGRGGARTVFVLQVNCKGAMTSPGAGAGSTQTWLVKKRYGYFERVHRSTVKLAAASGLDAPPLPKRKMLYHRDPKYLQALREELQLYLERAIDVVQRATTGADLGLTEVLDRLELPVANETTTWEQRSRFGVAADGKSLPVEMEGFLRKQGGSKSDKARGWKERWFVLTGSSLHYYQNPEAPSIKGTIELQHASVDAAVLGEEAFGMTARQSDGREVKLAAASAAKRTEWLAVLSRARDLPPSPPPASGPRDKRVAQLEAQRMQTRLQAQVWRPRRPRTQMPPPALVAAALLPRMPPPRAPLAGVDGAYRPAHAYRRGRDRWRSDAPHAPH